MAEDARFPIGAFEPSDDHSAEARTARIDAVARLPESLDEVLAALPAERLDAPYRAGGWTVRQLVHHIADSHLNAYIRFRLALTETHPTIKTYDQDAWAALPDADRGPLEPSLAVIRGVHQRWAAMLRALPAAAFERTVLHPDWGAVSVGWLLDQYAWHGAHHVAHIRRAGETRST